MHRWLLLLAGCGRLGFDAQTSSSTSDAPLVDARPCSPVGHDEDGDAVDDACDVCPHLPGAQADGDGDGVGDACDSEPTSARQQIIAFDTFNTLDPAWMPVGGVVVSNGDLILDAIGGAKEVIRAYTPNTDTFVIGMTTGAAGTGQYNFAIVTAPTNPPGGFYCEMFDDGGAFTTTMLTWTLNNTNYMHAGVADWPNNAHFANGSGTFSYALTPTTVTCESKWQSVTRGGTGARPAIAVEELHLYAENVFVRISYFLQIRTN